MHRLLMCGYWFISRVLRPHLSHGALRALSACVVKDIFGIVYIVSGSVVVAGTHHQSHGKRGSHRRVFGGSFVVCKRGQKRTLCALSPYCFPHLFFFHPAPAGWWIYMSIDSYNPLPWMLEPHPIYNGEPRHSFSMHTVCLE